MLEGIGSHLKGGIKALGLVLAVVEHRLGGRRGKTTGIGILIGFTQGSGFRVLIYKLNKPLFGPR